jgi:hypothetical protein
MADGEKRQGESLDETRKDLSIEGPRLTPQGRTDPDAEGEDSTNPMGEGAKQNHGSKAEGE